MNAGPKTPPAEWVVNDPDIRHFPTVCAIGIEGQWKNPDMAAPTVLLTGATGFVGGATLARLLESRPDCCVLLLARDRGSEAAADRVKRSPERFVVSDRAKAGFRSCEVSLF
jgi:hypothetical protein